MRRSRPLVPAAPVVQTPAVQAPIVAADDDEPVYRVGAVLPANVPLYAMPQNVALGVPATRRYSYAWLGGRAYVVDPTERRRHGGRDPVARRPCKHQAPAARPGLFHFRYRGALLPVACVGLEFVDAKKSFPGSCP